MISTRSALVVSFVLGALGACGPTAQEKHHGVDAGSANTTDAMPLPHTLDGITVTPTNAIVQLGLNTNGAQGYSAMGMYADGTTDDLTAQVTWTLANPAVGTMSNGTLFIPGFATATAVTSLVTASFGGLTGQGQITVVAYRNSGPQQDFFFILPYQDPAGAMDQPLDFSTAIPSLDVFFDMDTTGSMAGEIGNLQTALTGTVIPGIQAAVADTQFGVGAMEDFPISPYGTAGCTETTPATDDQPLKLFQTITNNAASVTTAVGKLSTATGAPIGCGNDGPEAGLESIYQISTGEGLTGPSPTNVPANHVGVGGVGFRTGTMPVVVTISDADSHGVGETGTCGDAEAYAGTVAAVAHTRAQTKTALTTICARFVGIAALSAGESAACTPVAYMTDLATTTGARVPPGAWDVGVRPAGCAETQCCTGQSGAGVATDVDGLCPMVFDVTTTGTGVSASIVTGIQMLARFATFDVVSQNTGVTTDINGTPLPGAHTTADFIKAVTPTGFTLPPPPPIIPNPTFDATTFHGVTPGTQVAFGVNAFNDFVPETTEPQIFRATITVLAGGCTTLDQRSVLILVPPMPITIQ